MATDIRLAYARRSEIKTSELKASILDLFKAIQEETDLDVAIRTAEYTKWLEDTATNLNIVARDKCEELSRAQS